MPNFSQELRANSIAIRLSKEKLGISKALSKGNRDKAADVFHASGDYVSGSSKILNRKNPFYKKVLAILTDVTSYLDNETLPFPETKIRLLKRTKLVEVTENVEKKKAELRQAVGELKLHMDEIRAEAKEGLGDLYNPTHYPDELDDVFQISIDFPSIEPPSYLAELSPEVYAREQARVAALYDQAEHLTEQMLAEELQKLVAHLTEKLTGKNEKGELTQLRDSAVENVKEFFTRFKDIGLTDNETLSKLVDDANQIVSGVEVKQIKDNEGLRSALASRFESVRTTLDTLVISKKKRKIVLETEGEDSEADDGEAGASAPAVSEAA